MDYFFQGKTNAYLNFELNRKYVEEKILLPLKSTESVLIKLTPEIFDANQKHLCTGTIEWQIKKWQSVKTKV